VAGWLWQFTVFVTNPNDQRPTTNHYQFPTPNSQAMRVIGNWEIGNWSLGVGSGW
jgi:hypothetical protein